MANRYKILIMAHDEVIRELLQDMVSDKFDTAVASDILQGTDLLHAAHFDLLVLEDRMPVIRGRDYLDILEASAEFQTLPVVIISAALELEQKIQARHNCRFLAMPFSIGHALELIQGLLGLGGLPHYAATAVPSHGLAQGGQGAAMTT